jgi:ADP-ribose pyrophosphatase YjhB (NUDIX family)/predicted transcriptional regulator
MDYQGQILKKLMYNPKLRFSDMQIPDMTSKHFVYYLKKLVEDKLISKEGRYYYLTDKGKEYVGRLDEKDMQFEMQPKISMAIIVEREGDDGEKEYLLSRRLKQPYYGKVGGFTGKLRFGETFEHAARRELLEETGLTGKFHLRHIKRKFAYQKEKDSNDRKIVQDQIMIFFLVTEPEGELITEHEELESFWVKYPDVAKHKDLYNTFIDFFEETRTSEMKNFEIDVEAEGY